MKQVVYKGLVLSNGSTARELWENWQREKTNRNVAQAKLDQHMKDVEKRYNAMMGNNGKF